MRYFLALPVWGELYVETFLRWALPTLLAPGNLCNGPFKTEQAHLLIYTTTASRKRIEQAPGFLELQNQLSVQWNIFDLPDPLPHRFYKHSLMSACYADAISLAQAHGGSLIPLVADNLFTEGAFNRIITAGKTADLVMIAGPRLNYKALETLQKYRHELSLRMSAPELTRCLLTYAHPHFQACFLDSPHFTVWPSHVYKHLNASTFEAHCYHLHPILIHQPALFGAAPDPRKAALNNLDGHYLEQYYQTQSRFAVLNHPALVAVTLSQPEDVPLREKEMSDAERQEAISTFAREYCLPVHHYFYSHRLIFETEKTSGPNGLC